MSLDEKTKDNSEYLAPPKKPRSKWQAALVHFGVGAALGAIFGRLFGFNMSGSNHAYTSPRNAMIDQTAASGLFWGLLEGGIGYYQGASEEQKYASDVEKTDLKNQIIDLKKGLKHTERIETESGKLQEVSR